VRNNGRWLPREQAAVESEDRKTVKGIKPIDYYYYYYYYEMVITVFSDVTFRSSSDTAVSCCHATFRCILQDVILIISVVSASDRRDLSLLLP
jgi:hypothetical protein